MSSLFRSIKFNVILFLIIAFLAMLGTFIPQTSDNADKVAALMSNHPLWGRVLNGWGFFDIYHTFLFAGLLGLMAFDVVICKLWNKPPDPGLVPLAEDHSDEEDATLQAVRKKPYRLEGSLPGSMAEVTRKLIACLKKENYTVRKIARTGGGMALVASRHRLQRWGSYVSHIAIVVILLGAMMKNLLGFETFLPILEGRSSNVVQSLYDGLQPDSVPDPSHPAWLQAMERMMDGPHRLKNRLLHHSLDPIAHWELWVDKLTVDFYHESTTPSTFASRVRLYNYDQTLADTTIRVNQPLDVHHVRFYQASWGVTGMIRGVILQIGNKTISAGMKGTFPIPDEPWTGRVEHYLPDFIIGPDGQPSTASLEWKHPAVVIGFYNKKNIQIGTLVLGAPSPVTPPNEEPWGMFFFAGGHLPVRPPFQVLSVEPVLFSGVQVSYDPGFPVIVTGVLSMVLGLCALFYLHQRRVIVFLRPDTNEEKVKVDVGAWSSRGSQEFEPEFRKLFRHLPLEEVGS